MRGIMAHPLRPQSLGGTMLLRATKHRGCVGVGHKQTGELALVIALDEPDACGAGNDTQSVEPTVAGPPGYGPDLSIHDRPEQSHTLASFLLSSTLRVLRSARRRQCG